MTDRRTSSAIDLDEHARKLVESWPELSAEQRARLGVLLRPVPRPVEQVRAA